MENKLILGNALEVLKTLPDNYVSSCITSPPYWQLRKYEGIPDYEWGDWKGQLGLEPTFEMYLNHLWQIFDEIKRVLRNDGTCWVNLGDTYGTSSGNMGVAEQKDNFVKDRNTNFKQSKDIKYHKCLLLIPHRFAIGMIDRGWILRNDIIWAKRNGMPESCKDRFSKKHEYIFFFVKNKKYYFDLDGVRDGYILKNIVEKFEKANKIKHSEHLKENNIVKKCGNPFSQTPSPLGKNPGDVSDFWDIPTKPSSVKHYATFNSDLINKPIIAGAPKDGIILDPFAGTCTTLIRAYQLGRRFIGIEGSQEYFNEAEKRINEFTAQQKLF